MAKLPFANDGSFMAQFLAMQQQQEPAELGGEKDSTQGKEEVAGKDGDEKAGNKSANDSDTQQAVSVDEKAKVKEDPVKSKGEDEKTGTGDGISSVGVKPADIPVEKKKGSLLASFSTKSVKKEVSCEVVIRNPGLSRHDVCLLFTLLSRNYPEIARIGFTLHLAGAKGARSW